MDLRMCTTPTSLCVVVHNKQRYAIPVNAAGIQVGSPVRYPNPNRRRRGGYGPGTVDGSSLSQPRLPAASERTDGHVTFTSESTTLHGSGHARSEATVSFTDIPTDDMNYGGFVQLSTAGALWLQLPQPSILRKSSGLLHALPPLFDFEYKSPHTPREPSSERKQKLPTSSVNAQQDEKCSESAAKAHRCTCCSQLLSAGAVPHYPSSSPSPTHDPLRNNSDLALSFVLEGDMSDTAAVSRAVHQLPISKAQQVQHLLGGGCMTTVNAATPTPKQPPAVMFTSTVVYGPRPPQSLSSTCGAQLTLPVACDSSYGTMYASYQDIISEYENDKAEKAASQGSGRGEATPTAQTARKSLRHLPRIKGENTASMPRSPRAPPAVVGEQNATRIASDLTQGLYSIDSIPSLSSLTPARREGDGSNISHLPTRESVAGKEPIDGEAQPAEMGFLMDRYFYGGQSSFSAEDVRAISPLGNYEEGMESSAVWKPRPPLVDSKATPRSQQLTAVPIGTPENVLPSPRDAAHADYEYVNPCTPITVSTLAVPSPLSVESFPRTSLQGDENVAECELSSLEVRKSTKERVRYAMLTLLQQFASNAHRKPVSVVETEESKVSTSLEIKRYRKAMVSESQSSTEALTSLTTASSSGTSCSDNESLSSTPVSEAEEDEDELEMVNPVDSPALSHPEKSPSPPPSAKGVDNGRQWRLSSIRERLMRPLIPLPQDIEKSRLSNWQKRYRATIKGKVSRGALQSGSANSSSATLNSLHLHARSPNTVK